jgi:transposase
MDHNGNVPTCLEMSVTGGVDTHADVHVCVAVCSQTMRRLGSQPFPVTASGYRALAGWLSGFGTIDAVGIEGTGTYGAGLSRFLRSQDLNVVEVNRPDRAARRLRGKTDDVDAEAAARAVLSGQASHQPKAQDGRIEAIRVLRVVYTSAVKDRTAALNQFHALISTAPEPLRETLASCSIEEQLQRAGRWRERTGDDVVTGTVRRAMSELSRRIEFLAGQLERVHHELEVLVEHVGAALLDLPGVGVHTAAQLLVAAGDNPDRIRTEAQFAHLCGTAPVSASSGKTNRHRLNYAGNRDANNALWRIVMARMAQRHDATLTYVARRTAEGLSMRDIVRCLKRFVAREIFRVITNPPPAAPTGATIRALRLQAGLTQTQLAVRTGSTLMAVSRVERGLLRRGQLQHHLASLLQQQLTT